MQLHAHTDWHAFYIILLNSVLLSFYVTHTYIHNIYIHCKYMYTHNLCISHAPLNNASHKANCHSLPKISKSRINLGNKSLSEIWSASRCGPERSAAWESWQPGCAKKGIRLLVSFFFLSFFPRGCSSEVETVNSLKGNSKTLRNGSGLKAVIAGSTYIILHIPTFGWQKTIKNPWFPADQEMIWALASTWMWTAADLTAFVLSLGLPKGELICSHWERWESPESGESTGSTSFCLCFTWNQHSKVIIYLNDVPWMHPWNQRLRCWASELPSHLMLKHWCPWEHC